MSGFTHESGVPEWFVTVRATDPAFAIRLNEQPSGCWEFVGTTNEKGYGKVHRRAVRRAPILAHRHSWTLVHGHAPDGILMHICDNPPCCNPFHLKVGTRAENNADMDRKGRRFVAPEFTPGDPRWQCEHPNEPTNWRNYGDRRKPRCRLCLAEYGRAYRQRLVAVSS